MKVAVLVKQVPRVEDMALGEDARLRREGVELEMNAYCRRAVSKGVELARASGGRCVVLTLGPPTAEEVLREALAWGADDGVLVSDPAFAGSDTLASARALAAAIERLGPFDLVLAGRNSIDADTGQVPPELAQLLDLPFASAVRELQIEDKVATVRCELDDGWKTLQVNLPAVLSVAERLTEPAKVPPEGRAAVPAERVRRIGSSELGEGPWGAEASPTIVGEVRIMEVSRHRRVLRGSAAQQVDEAVELLVDWGAVEPGKAAKEKGATRSSGAGPASGREPGVEVVRLPGRGVADGSEVVGVLVEPGRDRMARELLGEAAHLASAIGARVLALGPLVGDPFELASWGADGAVSLSGAEVEEDVAGALIGWCRSQRPWALLAPGTLWGREVASRVAAQLGAGLTGDAVGFGVEKARLVAWKPAFGGRLVAAITATSHLQLATVRPGVMPLRAPRPAQGGVDVETIEVEPARRVNVLSTERDDDVEALLSARAVVGVGTGVGPDEYGELRPLLETLGAELACSRKVTDKGWLPRARQVGVTGHSIDPAIYIAVGVSGKFNHMVGSRTAGTVVAINSDPDAPVFEWADVGMVADWHEVVPLLAKALE